MNIEGSNKEIEKNALDYWDTIAMPLGSLGELQKDVAKICGILETLKPDISNKCVTVFCADNGIVSQGVTQVGSDSNVTFKVAENMCELKSVMCIMSKVANAKVIPIDIGMALKSNHPNMVQKSIACGTNDFSKTPAMTVEDVHKAIEHGIDVVRNNLDMNVFATGEMGIGNTTSSTAVASVLIDTDVEILTGVGAGLSKEGVLNKIEVIKNAINLHKPNKDDVYDVLAKVGGFDICGIVGLIIGCAKYKKVCILDGFLSTVAALCAYNINENVLDFLLASHVSDYKSSDLILKKLKLKPVIYAGMRLGEGSGAVSFMPILDMGVKVFNEMITFKQLEIEDYKHLN